MAFEIHRFEIIVEPRQYYRNGDRVNCLLIIELNGNLKCKHLLITAIGELLAKFYRRDHYFEKKHFMSIPLNFSQIVNSDVITTGVYRIPFYFYLTNTMYPSFESEDGHVMYFVEAVIDKGLFDDIPQNAKDEFQVKAYSNIIPRVCQTKPFKSNHELVLRTFGAKVGTLKLSANLDKSIFDSGEPIYMSFNLDNKSPKAIRLLPQLIQKTTFKGPNQVLNRDKLIASNYADVCLENCSQTDRIYIPIPDDAKCSIASDVLDITYFIKLFVEVGDGSQCFDCIPVFIK